MIHLSVDVRARNPLDRIEIIGNGKVIQTFEAPSGQKGFATEIVLQPGTYSWIAVRCFEKAERTIRMAHSRPVFFADVEWDAREDARFFVRWIDELIAQNEKEPNRFQSDAERAEVLSLYRRAREIYRNKAK